MRIRLLFGITCLPLALSLTPADYARLDAGQPVVAVMPAGRRHVAIRAATTIKAAPESLFEWTRRIEDLQKSPYVRGIGRFSDPPQLSDLDGLSLDEEDLMDLRRCRPGSCGVKLSDEEIARIRSAMAAAVDWRHGAQDAFRAVVLARAQRYLAEGHGPLSSYHDEHKRVMLDAEFAALAAEVVVTHPGLFPVTNYLALYPMDEPADVESFLYWSKESLGAKPIVSVTHVAMTWSTGNGAAEALVAKKQVYASHYILASLSFTAIGASQSGSDRYLVYLNHSRSDVLDGLFGRFIRRMVEKRLRAEGPRALDELRRRLESVEPRETP